MTRGIDLASIDRNTNIDWAAAKAAGVAFAYLKRMQHVYPDPIYAAEAQHARDAGVLVGAYDFPGWGPSAASAKAQIAAFKNAPGAIVAGKDLPPAIDVERSTDWTSTGWTKAECAEFLKQLVLEFEDQLGVTPAIYTSFNQYDGLGRPAMPWASRCPSWVKTAYVRAARQPVYEGVLRDPHAGPAHDDPHDYHRIPDPWSFCAIEQVQGDVLGIPGFSSTVDVNRYRSVKLGDRDGLITWIQHKLKVPETGLFDTATDLAVRAFQTTNGLIADGIVGPRTFAAVAWIA